MTDGTIQPSGIGSDLDSARTGDSPHTTRIPIRSPAAASPPNHRRPWIQKDDDYIRWHWADLPLERIAEALGRTFDGIAMRAIKIGLGRPRHRGVESMKALAERTGYTRVKLLNACRKAGIIPRMPIVTNKGRGKDPYKGRVLSEEQVTKVLAFLAQRPDQKRIRFQSKGAWGEMGRGGFRKPPQCIDCGRNDRRHNSKGRCVVCHPRWRRNNPPAKVGGKEEVTRG